MLGLSLLLILCVANHIYWTRLLKSGKLKEPYARVLSVCKWGNIFTLCLFLMIPTAVILLSLVSKFLELFSDLLSRLLVYL
jgi:hypothetical protein